MITNPGPSVKTSVGRFILDPPPRARERVSEAAETRDAHNFQHMLLMHLAIELTCMRTNHAITCQYSPC